ncbi:SDR family oxidoreductase [Oceanobacillus profundus]|uniref:SDR family oxidoreductase n=1 Tax=Oceanobacillus profundus TaxID=372463 RepID=A0A417YKV7_9BACI|nr:SDR family oxidoreductase [Oceanobacillus profundus]MBR3120446.1 SDR family oxidoreductase [Oceanobacillus sp.]PAE30208.1 oxidoreductase [Paenibacillus sp. 7884-2]MCM3397072.1 SDR family oxidoreductase [Oceanobacillus profundus]MDO6449848.1 SDR family oxidoreductase [Oceanobacillus profundus]RHW33841.1 SDR family oxidoreductase [Oceanobacillus profundus]
MLKLKGKTAVVTGASSGIGVAIAKQLANEGADVVLAARRKDKLEQVVKEINSLGKGKALAVSTDVSQQNNVDSMVDYAVEAFGKIDIYVNNAGLVGDGIVRNENVKAWEQMIDVNIKGVLYGTHAVLPGMIERSSGHIINISSVSGQEVTKSTTVYSATKFAVRAISMGLEKELARTGVRVTNISPGMVETERNSERLPNDRKPLQTDDIAKAVIYALTQPDYVNVNEITVRPV